MLHMILKILEDRRANSTKQNTILPPGEPEASPTKKHSPHPLAPTRLQPSSWAQYQKERIYFIIQRSMSQKINEPEHLARTWDCKIWLGIKRPSAMALTG